MRRVFKSFRRRVCELFNIENLPTLGTRDKCYVRVLKIAKRGLRTRSFREAFEQSEEIDEIHEKLPAFNLFFAALCNEKFHRDEIFMECKIGHEKENVSNVCMRYVALVCWCYVIICAVSSEINRVNKIYEWTRNSIEKKFFSVVERKCVALIAVQSKFNDKCE